MLTASEKIPLMYYFVKGGNAQMNRYTGMYWYM